MTHFKWTPEAVATLRQLYPNPAYTCVEIGQRIGCSARAVVRKAGALKMISPRRHKSGPRNLTRNYRPMNEERRRYVVWFMEAGWPAHEVARLFNVHPQQVAA